jgi:hypothetical protein
MGWTVYRRPKGESDRAHFQRELFTNTDYEIVQCSSKNGVFYAAVRTTSTGEVWALVVLTRRARGEYNFGYKPIDESMGPVVTDAPASVLDALTPTDDEDALVWRQRCRDNLAKRSAARERQRAVTEGVVIQTAVPLNFKNGLCASRFACAQRSGRTIRWHAIMDDGTRFFCRLRGNWAERYNWDIVPEPPLATADDHTSDSTTLDG